jgi:hypothetical protein
MTTEIIVITEVQGLAGKHDVSTNYTNLETSGFLAEPYI